MSNIVIGWDQGSYTPNVGTRQITLSGLNFTPTITGLLYVHNYTQDKTYFAQAESYSKSITFTPSGDDWILEYQNLPTFPPLGASDVIHIQFASNNNVQYPMPTNGDSIYVKDIDWDNSDFTNWVGDPTELFKSPFSTSVTNSTSDNPKQIILAFHRTVKALQVGFGENNGGSFSNAKVSLLGSGGATRSVFDDSSDSTDKTSLNAEFGNELFNSLMIEFYTTDTVSLSNITIQKARYQTAQIEGQTPSGAYRNFNATESGNFKVAVEEYGDTPSIDAFARLRVSQNFTIYDSKQLHDKQPLFWDEQLGGSATSTHNAADAAVEMNVTANASDYVIRQTKQRFNYQPGKSQLIFMTFYCPQTTGTTKRIGCFDDDGTGSNLTPNNGIFLETDGTISWNIAKNGTVEETVTQSNWNVDTLDGSGDDNNPSGVTYNSGAVQILIIDYEWLGVGRVRVGFVVDGIIRYVHYFNHANDTNFTSVYMSTPNLPLRYDIQTDGTNGCTLSHICSTVISEGGIEKTGILRSVESGSSFETGYSNGVKYAMVGIKLKDTYKDITVIPEEVSIIIGTNDSFKWELQLNPVVDGTFTYSDLTNSAVQFAQGDNTNDVTSDGLIVGRGGGSTQTRSSSSDLKTALRIGSTIAGTKDELVLVLQPLSANVSAWADLNFRELL